MRTQQFWPVVDKASHERLSSSKLAVNAKGQQHDKKEAGPQRGGSQGEDDFGIDEERQSGSTLHHVTNLHSFRVGHVAEDGEDDGGGEEACEGVDGADEQGVPVAVVVELVVASQGKESTNADAIRVEDLSASVWGVGISFVKGFLRNCLLRGVTASDCFQEEGKRKKEKKWEKRNENSPIQTCDSQSRSH